MFNKDLKQWIIDVGKFKLKRTLQWIKEDKRDYKGDLNSVDDDFPIEDGYIYDLAKTFRADLNNPKDVDTICDICKSNPRQIQSVMKLLYKDKFKEVKEFVVNMTRNEHQGGL